jgi:hypothetical protein
MTTQPFTTACSDVAYLQGQLKYDLRYTESRLNNAIMCKK